MNRAVEILTPELRADFIDLATRLFVHYAEHEAWDTAEAWGRVLNKIDTPEDTGELASAP